MRTILSILPLLFVFACGPSTSSDQSQNNPPIKEGQGVVGEEMAYEGDSITMKGYIAYDAGQEGKRPGVLVVHEWWGHNDYSRERADLLAELGYVALAVDMYGDGKQAAHPSDAGKFASAVMQDWPGAEQRFLAVLETLHAHPQVDAEKVGAIGYCFGGGMVLAMANTGADLDAVASFHGGLGLAVMPEPGQTKARVLVCNGADDPFVSSEQIDAYTTAMDAAGADYEFVNYEGAVHGFTSKGADAHGEEFDLPLAYNQIADQDSWAKMQALFAEVWK